MYKIKDVVYIFTTPNHPFWLSDNSSLFISCFRFIHVHTIPIASMYIVYLPTFSYVFFYDTCYVNIPVRMLSYGIFNWMITCKKKKTQQTYRFKKNNYGRSGLPDPQSSPPTAYGDGDCLPGGGPECQLLVAHQWRVHRVDDPRVQRLVANQRLTKKTASALKRQACHLPKGFAKRIWLLIVSCGNKQFQMIFWFFL